jgi:enoyl-CoA hydratase
MSEPVLSVERNDGVVTVTLNRPQAMNALSTSLRVALRTTFAELSADPAVEVVILTGAGERAFCAGLDLKELGGEAPSAERAEDAIAGGDNLVTAIERCPAPVIGAVNGVAITGGFELALACDVLIASTHARFADTHARVGILPGWGLSQKLSRLVGIQRAKAISLTGNFVSADEALAIGLVSRVVAPQALLPTALQLANDMRSCVPETLRAYKKIIDEGFAQPFGEAIRLEARANREHAKQLRPEDIAARRAAIQARGRSQTR